jgi:hypothetical protein
MKLFARRIKWRTAAAANLSRMKLTSNAIDNSAIRLDLPDRILTFLTLTRMLHFELKLAKLLRNPRQCLISANLRLNGVVLLPSQCLPPLALLAPLRSGSGAAIMVTKAVLQCTTVPKEHPWKPP